MRRVLSSFSRAFRKSTTRPLSTAPVPKTTTTITSKMGSVTTTNADTFIELAKGRRTFYPLNKDLPISTSRIQTIVTELLQHVPSSFNSQSNRAVILFGAEHDKLWDITRDILKAIVPAEQWQSTADKMAMFKAGAGTVLFFEDETPVKALQEQFPPYADK
jgi:predicted oxidoreductase (fatty acid repression mutant protein)